MKKKSSLPGTSNNMTKVQTTTTKKVDPAPEVPVAGPATEAQPELSAKEQKEVRIIERVIENREIAPADAFGKLTRSQVELIKRTVAKGATDDELKMFVQVCRGAQLNPFMKQVHFVKRWDSREAREVGAIQVGIDGFRAVAEGSGAYAGNDDPVYEGEKDIEIAATQKSPAKKVVVPLKATVTVYKIVEGQRYAFTATARWEEYYPGPKMGFQWHIRPYLMLGKCAEALALRKTFPKLLSGMYAQEEMDRGASESNDAEKLQKARNHVADSIAKANLKELEDLRKLIVKSTKYEDDQKAEFLKMVDDKIAELKAQSAGATKPEVPTVQVDQ